MDLFGPVALQRALLQATALAYPAVQDVHVLLDQRHRQLSLPPPVGLHLPDDSPLRSVSVTPHALAGYDSLTQEDSDDPR